MLKYFFIVLGFLCFVQLSLSAQKNAVPPKAYKFFEQANTAYLAEKKAETETALLKAVKEYPDYYEAFKLLSKVQAELNKLPESRENALKIAELKPEEAHHAYNHIGKTYMVEQNYPEAIRYFQMAIDRKTAPPKMKEELNDKIKACNFRLDAKRGKAPLKLMSLGKNVNTPQDEYLPTFTADVSMLLFTRRVGSGAAQNEDFFYCQQDTSGAYLYDTAYNLGEPINTEYSEGALNISVDGKRLFFAAADRKGAEGGFDIYYSYRVGDEWVKPSNIGTPINTPAWESQPCLSADGTELFFSSTRPGGKGGRDLWVSRLKNNAWQQPENLGEAINTAFDEQCPFLHPDGKTLYFSSKGHIGMGDADIFKVTRSIDGKWGKPENLGYPINTENNENSLVITPDGKYGFFGSMTDSAGIDLFYFELPQAARPEFVTYVKATVVDAATQKPLAAEVEIIDLGNNTATARKMSDAADGTFLVTLPVGKNYLCNVQKANYALYSANFALEKVDFQQPYELKIALEPLPQAGTPAQETHITLHNVFFASNSYQLQTASFIELDKMVDLLKEKSGLSVQIIGHTDDVGDDAANLALSENRAKAVYEYLIQKGIAAARLQYSGKGESQPIADNNTETGRAQNRRTEFILREK